MSAGSHISDEDLVVEIRTKQKERFGELVRRYQNKLMRYAMTLTHDMERSQDIVQESFISAYVHLNGYDTKRKFSSWMYRIVHNTAINQNKKYTTHTPIQHAIDIPSDEDIEQNFTKQELQHMVRSCLDSLPLLYREPLELSFIEEVSYEDISDILRIPMGTVATRINRAKLYMKHLCEKNN